MIGPYQTARAFRAALEERLKRLAREQHTDLMRLRRQVAFDRLLARLFAQPGAPWMLKGGYTFELRLGGQARATKDLDLSVPDLHSLAASGAEPLTSSDVIRECLQDFAAADLGDGFAFRIGMPMADLDAAPYGGARYPVEARLDARTFATFHLDVGIGDAIVVEPEWLTGSDLLGFAGIPPARVAALAREQQFAEKIHAYTLPRGDRTNTRVKDLVDLALLIELGLPDIEPPPEAWRAAFAHLAVEIALRATTLDAAYAKVAAFLEGAFAPRRGRFLTHSSNPSQVWARTRVGERMRSGRCACWAVRPTTRMAA